MKSTTKKTLLILIPVLAIGLTAAVFAQQSWGKMMGQQKWMEKLELENSQKEKIEEIRFDAQQKKIDLQADLKKTRLEMMHEMKKDDVNKEKVMDLIEQAGNTQTELKKIQMSQMIDIKGHLTEEQQEKAKEYMGKMHKGMMGHKGECPMAGKGGCPYGEGRKEGMMKRGRGMMDQERGMMHKGMKGEGRGMKGQRGHHGEGNPGCPMAEKDK